MVLSASTSKVVAVRQDGEPIKITGNGLRAAALEPGVQSQAGDDDQSRCCDPPGQGERQGLANQPGARGGIRFCCNGPTQRWQFVPWWADLIFRRTSSITSPRPGASRVPASSRSFTQRRWKRACRQPPWSTMRRCFSVRRDRGQVVGTQELRRAVRRADVGSARVGQVKEPGVYSGAATGGTRECASTGSAGLAFRRTASTLPDHGAGCRLSDPHPDGDRLRGLCQRRLPGRAEVDHARGGAAGPGVVSRHQNGS